MRSKMKKRLSKGEERYLEELLTNAALLCLTTTHQLNYPELCLIKLGCVRRKLINARDVLSELVENPDDYGK